MKSLAGAIWSARGGGYYASGFVVTFLWLEFTTFVTEVVSAESVGSFLTSQLFEFVVRFTVQSLENTVTAFLWPLLIIDRWQGLGLFALLLGYVVFRKYLKRRLETWFVDGNSPPSDERCGTPDERQPADER